LAVAVAVEVQAQEVLLDLIRVFQVLHLLAAEVAVQELL
jgi:hypothetical protein